MPRWWNGSQCIFLPYCRASRLISHSGTVMSHSWVRDGLSNIKGTMSMPSSQPSFSSIYPSRQSAFHSSDSSARLGNKSQLKNTYHQPSCWGRFISMCKQRSLMIFMVKQEYCTLFELTNVPIKPLWNTMVGWEHHGRCLLFCGIYKCPTHPFSIKINTATATSTLYWTVPETRKCLVNIHPELVQSTKYNTSMFYKGYDGNNHKERALSTTHACFYYVGNSWEWC